MREREVGEGKSKKERKGWWNFLKAPALNQKNFQDLCVSGNFQLSCVFILYMSRVCFC